MSTQIVVSGMLVNLNNSTPNKNGRIYPKDVFENAVKDFQNRILLEDRKKKIDKICQNLQIKKENN